MSIDIASIKPGGKVSVTLPDGTKIVGAEVKEFTCVGGPALFILSTLLLVGSGGGLGFEIKSLDDYTPPVVVPVAREAGAL